MPLEINEIDIKMQVGDSPAETRQNHKEDTTSCGDRDYEAIVDDCTRRVLQRLGSLQER